jgi:amidophosphoribosyltransferase
MLREAGAKEIHVRISSPPVKWPCFYGIDFATGDELVANGNTVDEIRKSIGADSLGYVSLDALTRASTIPEQELCRACFDGHYPIPLPEPEKLGKDLLEEWQSEGAGSGSTAVEGQNGTAVSNVDGREPRIGASARA